MTAAAVYAELRRRSRLRARLPVYQQRLGRAEARIHEAMARGSTAVMFSGGKDSTVVLDLAWRINPSMPAFFFDCGAETPWTYAVIDQMAERGDIDVIGTSIPLVEMLKQVGMFGYEGPERLPGDWHWTPQQIYDVLIGEPAEAVRAMGFPVHLLGLRMAESPGRAWNRLTHGTLYERRDGAIISTPIADWEDDDVLAYITIHDLPLSEVYLQPDDPERGKRRSAPALLTTGVAYGGAWRRLREQQPALWQELCAIFPEMRRDA